MKAHKRSDFNGISIGSASILMVFVALCLTVFATLALVTANAENKLVQRERDTVIGYYEADYRAAQIYDEICTAAYAGDIDAIAAIETADSITVNSDELIITVSYTVDVDERQALCVGLELGLDDVSVTKWSLESKSTTENTEGNNEFWDGSSPII